MTKIAILLLFTVVGWVAFGPSIDQTFIRLLTPSETGVLSSTGHAENGALVEEHRELEIVTLLGFDGIPAILNPTFVLAEGAEDWMDPSEPVLGLSIDGDRRAYSIRMLSQHEIVIDVVGVCPWPLHSYHYASRPSRMVARSTENSTHLVCRPSSS